MLLNVTKISVRLLLFTATIAAHLANSLPKITCNWRVVGANFVPWSEAREYYLLYVTANGDKQFTLLGQNENT